MSASEFYAELGHRVRDRRQELRLSQEALAVQLGLRRSSIANLEKGVQRISAETLASLASALLIGIEELTPKPDRNEAVGRLIDAKAPASLRATLRAALIA